MHLHEAAVNASVDAVTDLLDGGTLHLYDAANRELAVLGFAHPAFKGAVKGRAEARAMKPESSAKEDGLAVHYVARTAAGGALIEGDIQALPIRKNLSIGLDRFIYEQPMQPIK